MAVAQLQCERQHRSASCCDIHNRYRASCCDIAASTAHVPLQRRALCVARMDSPIELQLFRSQRFALDSDSIQNIGMLRTSMVFGLVTLLVGCASSNRGIATASPTRATPPTAAAENPKLATAGAEDTDASKEQHDAAPADTENALVAALPTSCVNPKECVPPKEFVSATCRARFPSMAIAMFEKHTPWQRLYVRVESLDAVNAYGERSAAAPMTFGEEVLVLRGVSQPKAGKLQISSSDIDVLRWDGSCATVDRGNFSTTRMADMVIASIRWRHLEDSYQTALLESKYVALAHEKHRSVCKGARDATLTPECQKATQRLTEAISVAVHGGLTLPTPTHLPAWAKPDQVKENGAVALIAAEAN